MRILATLTVALATSSVCVTANSSESGTPLYSSAAEYLGASSIVLSATRYEQPVGQAPSAVTIIDRDLIDAMGYKDLTDLFRHVPGMFSAHSRGNRHNVAYHGLRDNASRRMQVLIDGRSIYTPQFSGVEWEDLPLSMDDIERIEVIRSPNSVAFGSNAFSATINIITRDPADDYGTRVSLRAGNKGIVEGTFGHTFRGANSHTSASFGIRHENTLFERQRNYADGKTVPWGRVRSKIRLSAANTLDVQAGYSGGTRDSGETPDLTQPPTKDSVRASYLQAIWRHHISPQEEISLNVYRNTRTVVRDYLTLPLPLPGFQPPGLVFNPRFDIREERTEIELQHKLPLGNNARGLWGFAVRHDDSSSPQIYGNRGRITNTVARVFGTLQYDFSDTVSAHAGLMIEDNELGGTEVMPRLALNWQFKPRHVLRTSISRATRAPTFGEEASQVSYNFNGILLDIQDNASGGLEHETLNAFEIGYLTTSADGRWSLDAKIFAEQTRNIIAEIRPPTPLDPPFADGVAFDWINQDSADTTGAEFQIDYRDRNHLLRITHTELDIDGSDLSDRSLVSKSGPRRTTSLFYQHQLPAGLAVGVAVMRTGSSIPLASNLVARPSTRLDLRLSKRFRKGNVRGSADLTIENLMNSQIDEYKGLQNFDRRGYISLRLNW